MKSYYTAIELPTGLAFAAATERGITRLALKVHSFAEFAREVEAESGTRPVESEKHFGALRSELESYFAGEPVSFSARLDVAGTDFQRRVWRELMRVPYGNVRSYKWLAAMCGNPRAARAVGGALNGNKVAVVIPCHRIVETSGGLGGFGCGLDVKRALLELEGVLPPRSKTQ